MGDFSVTQRGKPLDESLYSIDLKYKTFSSRERNLVLDFTGLSGWNFNTGSFCTLNTGYTCNFDTGSYCTFTTSNYCTFDTSFYSIFNTGDSCTFMLYEINTCKFKRYDGVSIILDLNDNKRYVLTKELIDMIKVING